MTPACAWEVLCAVLWSIISHTPIPSNRAAIHSKIGAWACGEIRYPIMTPNRNKPTKNLLGC